MAKKKIKFPSKKVAINALLSVFFGSVASLAETFMQNNVQTAAVIQGLANGNNSVAEYTRSLPRVAGAILIFIAVLCFGRAVFAVVKYFVQKSKD